MKRYITVAGNIGVGKSSLVTLLGEKLGWQPFFEPVAQNPYLPDFYLNMHAWGFHSQVFFLANRLKIQRQILLWPDSVVQDRSIYEDAEIFALNLALQGYLSQRDYETYRALYHAMNDFLPPPDLVIYLRASVSTLIHRINQRSRDYEKSISPEYLHRLNDLYRQWIDHFTACPVLTVPADDLDYVAHPGHLNLIIRKIEEKLTGKEVVVFNPEEMAQAD
jgi:deoxyadenosine/deoxycytidine kinase